MRIEKFNISYVDEDKQIRAINDVYKKTYIDENEECVSEAIAAAIIGALGGEY